MCNFDVVCCHGGAGIISQAIFNKVVPFIVPIFGDQFTQAHLVEYK